MQDDSRNNNIKVGSIVSSSITPPSHFHRLQLAFNMWFSSRKTFLLLLSLFVILSTTSVTADDKPSCLGYSKGSYTGNVTSESECRTACEKAEGLPTPDFKTSTCEGDVKGTNYKCNCKKCDSNNANCQNRGLCIDTICSGAGTYKYSAMIGLTVMVAGFLLASMDSFSCYHFY